jgi:tripartite-type tricarboxylate transporter receptor subunit TctC
VQFSKHVSKSNRRFGLSLIGSLSLISSLGFGLLGSSSATAQAYPNKPIRLVVTFSTGGAPDILARLFSEKSQLGQPVVVDNKPGAGGNIGGDVVAKSAGDGYTLVMGTVGTHSINGSLYEKMPYDMVKNFTPISLIASAPNLLVVNNDLPVKTVNELIVSYSSQ